jgi:hypothetical protein
MTQMEDFEEGGALLLKSRLEALTRVLKKEVEDDTRFEKLLDSLTSYLEVIYINNKQRHYTSSSSSSSSLIPFHSSSSREGERDEGEGKVKRRLEFLISNGLLLSLRQGLEHEDSRVKSISLRLLGRFSASHLLSFQILEGEEEEKNLLEKLLLGCLKDEEMEEEALLRDSSLVTLTSLLSSPWGLEWFLTKTQPKWPSPSSSLPSLCDRLLFRAFKAFDDPSKFVSNSSVELLSTLVNGICHSMSTTISSSSSSASSFLESHIKTLELISKLLEQHLFSPDTSSSAFPSSDSKQHSLSLLMSFCRLVFRTQEEGQKEKRRLLLHFLSLHNLIPRSFLLVRDSDRFVRSNAVGLISVTTQSRCYSLFLTSVSASSLSSLLFTSSTSMLVEVENNKPTSIVEEEGEEIAGLETSKFIRDEVVRWLLLREGNQKNILTALSVVACSSFLHNSSAVLWKQKLFHRLCVLSLSLWFPSSQASSLLLDERLNSYHDPEENQLLSIMVSTLLPFFYFVFPLSLPSLTFFLFYFTERLVLLKDEDRVASQSPRDCTSFRFS